MGESEHCLNQLAESQSQDTATVFKLEEEACEEDAQGQIDAEQQTMIEKLASLINVLTQDDARLKGLWEVIR